MPHSGTHETNHPGKRFRRAVTSAGPAAADDRAFFGVQARSRTLLAVIGQDDLVVDVLRDPEVYAATLGFEEILLYAAAIFVAGWMIYRVTQRLELALLIQTPVFFNDSNFLSLSPIAPEALLYGVVILASALAVAYGLESDDARRRRFFPVAFGVLAGVGLATKVTYLPAAILPMILLDSWVGVIGYLLGASVSFAVLSIPHWATVYRAFANQLEDLYPKMLFWDAYRRVFENFHSTVTIESLGDCNTLLLEGTPLGVQPMGFSPPDRVSVEELGRFNGEAFYGMTCQAGGSL